MVKLTQRKEQNIQMPAHTQEGNRKRVITFSCKFHVTEPPKLTAKGFKIAKRR